MKRKRHRKFVPGKNWPKGLKWRYQQDSFSNIQGDDGRGGSERAWEVRLKQWKEAVKQWQ